MYLIFDTEGSNPSYSLLTMSLKHLKPITPGTRHRRIIDKSLLWKGEPYKPLTSGLSKTGGRNVSGHITVRHIGGGNKRTYRFVDFKRLNTNPAIVLRLEYDPNRSAFIALIQYTVTNEISYILAPQTLKVGDIINKNPLSIGSVTSLKNIPIGSYIHNVELTPGSGGQLVRTAGNYAQLVALKDNSVTIQLISGRLITLNEECRATIGKVSNAEHSSYKAGKAGISRMLGRRPTVKGEAMNPVDHPHGGRTRGGRVSVTPWGKITHGKKTVKK
jgi:large subunit ribosomal protein L2